jgi:hypothetical protein
MERETRSCLRLTFWSLDSSFLIIPDLYCLVLACCGYEWLSDTYIHTNKWTGVIMRVNRLKSEFDGIFIVLAFDFTGHECSIGE